MLSFHVFMNSQAQERDALLRLGSGSPRHWRFR